MDEESSGSRISHGSQSQGRCGDPRDSQPLITSNLSGSSSIMSVPRNHSGEVGQIDSNPSIALIPHGEVGAVFLESCRVDFEERNRRLSELQSKRKLPEGLAQNCLPTALRRARHLSGQDGNGSEMVPDSSMEVEPKSSTSAPCTSETLPAALYSTAAPCTTNGGAGLAAGAFPETAALQTDGVCSEQSLSRSAEERAQRYAERKARKKAERQDGSKVSYGMIMRNNHEQFLRNCAISVPSVILNIYERSVRG
jgi:hypothetical protein